MLRLLAFALCSLVAAQDSSVLPPDLQQQVDRIRSQSHLKTDPPPPPEPARVVKPAVVALDAPGDADADAADMEAILAGSAPVPLDRVENSREVQASTQQKLREMIAAAQRRVTRTEAKLARAQASIANAATLQGIMDELSRRKQMVELVNMRAALMSEVIEMAQAEVVRPNGARMVNAATLRYDGSGRLIRPAEFATLSAAFVRRFAKTIPISAWGESMTHVELGFDHRGRIDVAVYPDSAEGRFIRGWLEKQRIPYFAFRTALLGRATGPHIHIGPGSVRTVRASLRTHMLAR